MRILVIGTLPPPLGGASVSLSQLVSALQQRPELSIDVVNTSGVRGHALMGGIRFLGIALQILWKARTADIVSLQPVPSGLPYIGPIVWLSVKLWRKPLMIRMFGGQEVHEIGGLRGKAAQFFVHASDIYLVETKAMLRIANEKKVGRVEWYPTGRSMGNSHDTRTYKTETCKRFVFVGHVKPEKGIQQILALEGKLPDGVSVDVYGPFMDGITAADFDGKNQVTYKGVFRSENALNVLSAYDSLLLPSYWRGEGYPGVLFEGLAVGLPIVTTRWRSIPEVVDESCGILIEPKDTDALLDAITRLSRDADLVARLRQGTVARREMFNADHWVDRFIEYCREAVKPA